MASARYPYPADLDSDDDGSIEYYDWDNDSQVDDDSDDLSNDMDRLRIRGGGAGPQMCVVCKLRPRYNQNGKSYPTCGLTCASKLPSGVPGTTPRRSGANTTPNRTPSGRPTSQYLGNDSRFLPPFPQPRVPRPPKLLCVVCKGRPVYRNYVTCSPVCIEKLCKDGPSDTTVCTYCHRRPKIAGKDQCGQTCADDAKVACLLCKVRPRNGKYHLCGNTCKSIAAKTSPLILEVPKGHTTFDMVEQKFKKGWSDPAAPPTITRIYKIIEDEDLRRPYDMYRQRVGPKEYYRYHGTGRKCKLGVSTTKLCTSSSCTLCNILRTSFNVNLAKANGAFGKGIYTSKASNKAFTFCGSKGAMLLTKVVLGKVKQVTQFNEVMACPPGYNSVNCERMVGTSNRNETVVYSNDAIRPVFLIMFQ